MPFKHVVVITIAHTVLLLDLLFRPSKKKMDLSLRSVLAKLKSSYIIHFAPKQIYVFINMIQLFSCKAYYFNVFNRLFLWSHKAYNFPNTERIKLTLSLFSGIVIQVKHI